MHPFAACVGAPVAVIDDDIRFIRMIERALSTEDIPVQPITTLDLAEAVHLVGQSSCRAALVDVLMYGEASGFALIEKLRSDKATARVPILVTSGARREVGRHVPFLRQHDCGVLLKPFAIDELVRRLRSICSDGGTPMTAALAPLAMPIAWAPKGVKP